MARQNIIYAPHRDHSGYRLSQSETTLHYNAVFHWLNPYAEWSLPGREVLWVYYDIQLPFITVPTQVLRRHRWTYYMFAEHHYLVWRVTSSTIKVVWLSSRLIDNYDIRPQSHECQIIFLTWFSRLITNKIRAKWRNHSKLTRDNNKENINRWFNYSFPLYIFPNLYNLG